MIVISFSLHSLRNQRHKKKNTYQFHQLYTPYLSLLQKTTKMVICNFCYMRPNLSLLGSRWSQHALLIGFEAREPNGSLLAELRQGQHFCVPILEGGGYKVDKTGKQRQNEKVGW